MGGSGLGGSPCQGGCLLWGGLVWGGLSLPGGGFSLLETPPCGQNQMLVKTLPWPNFVAAGNNKNAFQ